MIAVDFLTNRIHVFDYETLELLHVFGRDGSGPGESRGATYAVSDAERLFVFDAGNHRVNVYQKANWTFEKILPLDLLFGTRFIVSPHYIYAASYYGEKPFFKLDIEDDPVAEVFGDWIGPGRGTRNEFNLLSYEDKIIAVSKTEPVVQFYDQSGELLIESVLDDEPLLSERLNFITRFYQNLENRYQTVTLFRDASVFGQYLLINYYTRPEDRVKYNNYLVYRIGENDIKKVASFETEFKERSATTTFCVHKNRLYSDGGPLRDLYVYDLDMLVE